MHAYVVVYESHDKDYHYDHPVAVGLDVAAAQKFILGECQGQKWQGMTYVDGDGIGFRRVVEYGDDVWGQYRIVWVELAQ